MDRPSSARIAPTLLPTQPAAWSATSDNSSASQMASCVAESLPEPGTEFLGFEVVEELGRGAFGYVYLARQRDLAGRLVVLKVACDIAAESQALAQLQHPNIVPIYSAHRSAAFQAVCMPYLGRTTLADVFRHRTKRPGFAREVKSTLRRRGSDTLPQAVPSDLSDDLAVPTPAGKPQPVPDPTAQPGQRPSGWSRLGGLSQVEAVLSLGSQLADGLAHAHARGIVHRDLKPANVLLTDDGRPMLLDFNLAEDVKQPGATRRAAVGGTLPYMAPEHLEAFQTRRGAPDGRSDIYALGVMLFEMLTGHHPFPVRPRAGIAQMLADRRQPPSLRECNPAVSPATEAIVRKCLEYDPADRYQTAEQLREDLDRQLANLPLAHAADRSLVERATKWARRDPWLAAGTVAAVFGSLLAVVTAVV